MYRKCLAINCQTQANQLLNAGQLTVKRSALNG